MQNNLKGVFKGKTVIVGIGNTMKGDDGFGPALIERIKGNISAVCVDAGSAPENYTGKIAREKPDTILIVDVVHLGKAPGEYEILRKSDILKSGFTTHDISPNMFIEYLEKETKADIYMLGVQPERVNFGGQMSEDVKKALDEVSELIIDSLTPHL